MVAHYRSGAAPTSIRVGGAAVSKVMSGGVQVWPAGVAYRDDFAYPNQAGWGPNFRLDVSDGQIASGRAQAGGYTDSSHPYWATYVPGRTDSTLGRLATDDMSVEAQLTPGMYAMNNATPAVALIIRAHDAWASGTRIGLFVRTTSASIIATYGASGASETVRAQGGPAATSTSLIRFTAIGDVYTGYIDGTQVLQWTDTSRVTQRGVQQRHFGLLMTSTNVWWTQYGPPAVEWIAAKDI